MKEGIGRFSCLSLNGCYIREFSETKLKMQEAYINICDIPTHIITWGKWIEESLDDVKEIVLCITGNPGVPGYYTQFLSTVYNNLDANIPVWIIGQAGHDDPPSASIKKVPLLAGNKSCYNLQGQIKHKIEFIEKYIPRHVKIHLIGHSIGSWMILQLLKHSQIKERVQRCYLLFPTIERMEESPNGWFFTKVVVPFIPVLRFLLMLIEMLPVFVRVFFISIYFMLVSVSTSFTGNTLKYINVPVIDRIVFLAKEEMSTVRDLEIDLVKHNKNLLKLYYGRTDGWVPVKYYKEIKEKIPDLDAELDNDNIFHAFVLRSSPLMAAKVASWIKENSASLPKQ